jgi:hypothetical protein
MEYQVLVNHINKIKQQLSDHPANRAIKNQLTQLLKTRNKSNKQLSQIDVKALQNKKSGTTYTLEFELSAGWVNVEGMTKAGDAAHPYTPVFWLCKNSNFVAPAAQRLDVSVSWAGSVTKTSGNGTAAFTSFRNKSAVITITLTSADLTAAGWASGDKLYYQVRQLGDPYATPVIPACSSKVYNLKLSK